MSDQLHVYGTMASGPVRCIVSFCRLSSIPYEFHEVSLMKKENFSPEFTRINPFQTVPAITHGDYNLWESSAIVTYLSEVFDTDNKWYPKDLKIRARINAYLHWHHDGVRSVIAQYTRPKFIFPKFFGAAELSAEADAKLRTEFEKVFETIKWLISDTGFIARTPESTIADIFACCELTQTKMFNYSFDAYPEVKLWYDSIMSTEVLAEVSQVIYEIASKFN